jgi:hypothetical protein
MIGSTFWEKHDWQHILLKEHEWQHILGKKHNWHAHAQDVFT